MKLRVGERERGAGLIAFINDRDREIEMFERSRRCARLLCMYRYAADDDEFIEVVRRGSLRVRFGLLRRGWDIECGATE